MSLTYKRSTTSDCWWAFAPAQHWGYHYVPNVMNPENAHMRGDLHAYSGSMPAYEMVDGRHALNLQGTSKIGVSYPSFVYDGSSTFGLLARAVVGGFSFAGWFHHMGQSVYSSGERFAGFGSGSTGMVTLGLTSLGYADFRCRGNLYGSTDLNDNDWHFGVITSERLLNKNRVRRYVDAEEILASQDNAGFYGSYPFWIGHANNNSRAWRGAAGDIYWWWRTLTDYEIREIYEDNTAPYRHMIERRQIVTVPAAGGQTISPTAVTVPIVVPAPTVVPGAITVSTTAVAVPVVIPAPTVTPTLTVTTTAPTVPIAVPAPTVTPTLTVSATAITVPVVVPAPAVGLGAITISPSAITVPITVGSPSVDTGTTISPTAVTVPIVVPAPTVVPGAITVTTTAVTVPITVGGPTVTTGTTVSATAVTVPIVVPSPTVSFGTLTVTPSPATVPITVGTPTIDTGQVISVSAVTVPITVGSPTIDYTILPTAVAVTLLVPAPTIIYDRTISAMVASVQIVVPTPTIISALDHSHTIEITLFVTAGPGTTINGAAIRESGSDTIYFPRGGSSLSIRGPL